MASRPAWWGWDLELTAHLVKRMEDRHFTEIELRGMLDRARSLKRDIAPGRWVVQTSHRRVRWEVIVEPDPERRRLVIVTAYMRGTP